MPAMATQAKTVYPHITKDPDVCSGSPCVAGTRMRVIDIVTFQEQGMTPDQMVEEFPSLESTVDVYAALVYYADHKDEIEAEYEEGEGEAEEEEDHDRMITTMHIRIKHEPICRKVADEIARRPQKNAETT